MSEKKVEVPVWTWRDAIRKAPVKPLTKHICNCIANYVSDVGEGAFPSVRALMADSGLSNRVVALHLRLAEEAGLLHIDRSEPSADGRFRRSRYYPRFPDNTVLKRKADRITTPANDVDDPAEDEDDDAEDQVTESHSAKPSDGKSLGGKMNQVTFQHEPSDFRDINRVTESHLNSPVELSTELSNAHDVRARVRKKFGLMIADLWDEKPELRYVVEIFLGPLHAATRRAPGIEQYPAFLAEIRDGIGAKDYPIPVLERACELAKDDRVAMPGRPQCLAYCEQASADIAAERQSTALRLQAEAMRASIDPAIAGKTLSLHDRMVTRLGRKTFDAWFGSFEIRERDGERLVVSVIDKFVKNWIEQNFAGELAECAAAEFPGVGRVEIELRKPPRVA